ncbi:anti-sigma regulatory factor (Ser/Thr protein kinase) [Streptomyces candidus]|uniref:Anti-sigma regulatory factor (Ser/Thr protein kinase) n=2 Tax=Streptomyces candidus TaxID=67283 RepID=A0A7X0HB89_9ACTN|nr:anti-sigma regulatory factor (Ser/Thr protein kinase) [Streptomyces candidus]
MTRQHPVGAGPVVHGCSAAGGPGTSNADARAPAAQMADEDGRRYETAGLRRRLGHADLTAVPEVRHALRELLRCWGRPGRADIAELLTCELVTNALIHTEGDAEVTAALAAARLRVEVRDRLEQLPEPLLADAEPDGSTHGRGLFLVQALADAWGVRMQGHGGGKVVWFELDGDPTAE